MRLQLVLAFGLMSGLACHAQDRKPMPKDATPVYEVATVKPSDPAADGSAVYFEGQRFIIRNLDLLRMIQFAYGLHKDQVLNAPAWVKDHFDVEGVPDVPGDPSVAQMQGMLRQLLSERFGLKFHRDQKELPMYGIVVAKDGAKMERSKQPSTEGPNTHVDGGRRRMMGKFTNVSMDEFALNLQDLADRPVVNQTGLAGRFDFTLTWNPTLADTTESADVPPLFTAMREQLGLKMEAKKAPVGVLIVDALSRPTDN